jgi:nitroimidazol reductase NimA-like FMN-containing flavoprotein (pyridoxamine 5'-phosphate oxidase superfamily)
MPEQTQQPAPVTPQAGRPQMPGGYGVPAGSEGMLPWSHASNLLETAINYWIGTTRPNGRPHSVPVWGVWLDDTFYFEGGLDTRRGRNIAANPAVVVHVERDDDIVIVEGDAEAILTPDSTLSARLVEAFGAKYGPSTTTGPTPPVGKAAASTASAHRSSWPGTTSPATPPAGGFPAPSPRRLPARSNPGTFRPKRL